MTQYPKAVLFGNGKRWHLLRAGYERVTRCGRVTHGGVSRAVFIDATAVCSNCERSYLRAAREWEPKAT